MHVTQEDEDEEEESSLLMVIADEHENVLLQGMSDSLIYYMWYLDTGASIHITSMKTFYHSLDESHTFAFAFIDNQLTREDE